MTDVNAAATPGVDPVTAQQMVNEAAQRDAAATEQASDSKGPAVGQAAPDSGGESVDSLPEWAQRLIRDLRDEAGGRRAKLREAEQKIAESKSLEEFNAAKAEWESQQRALLRENVALKYGLPADFAPRLQGDSLEQLEKDAAEMQKLLRRPAGRQPNDVPTGGLAPSAGVPKSPLELALEARRVGAGRYLYH